MFTFCHVGFEEQEELWISWEGELHRGLEEADITEFTVTPVKSEEDDEENPQSLHQSQPEENRDEHLKSEADGEDCGGPEPDRNLNPDHLQPDNDDETSHSSEPETDDSCDKEDVREPQSDLNRLQNNEEHVSDVGCDTVRSQKHNGVQTGVKPFRCSVCGKRYSWKKSLTDHMRLHSEGKRFSCSVCNKTFQWRRDVVMHMRIHTGEKPFSCSFCGKRFAQNGNLTSHLRGHTGEKPFACSICKKSFADSSTLTKHMKVHTREKSFSCSVCSETFSRKEHLKKHFTIHAGEKSATTRVRSHGGETA
ncbi:zinc finger protein 135-like [Morone saxatilis]|uniref:zinc finger protein 135-like n=1 Tax=Morone saxatilis TaxID=34816 RepID=UPI0015E24A14|nr:zinc finger protein 135-like [Morone saxatilis]